MNTNIINMHIMHYFWVFSYILNSFKKLCDNFFHVEGEVCGIVCHYPIYGDRLLIGRSNLLYACAKHPFALFSASRWHRRAGGLQPTRTRTWLTINKMWSNQVMCFIKTTRSTQTPLRHTQQQIIFSMTNLFFINSDFNTTRYNWEYHKHNTLKIHTHNTIISLKSLRKRIMVFANNGTDFYKDFKVLKNQFIISSTFKHLKDLYESRVTIACGVMYIRGTFYGEYTCI